MVHPKFVQIATTSSTRKDDEDGDYVSHYLYALDETGEVWCWESGYEAGWRPVREGRYA